MKFVIFVEGQTEKSILPDFIKRWLDCKLKKSAWFNLREEIVFCQYKKEV